MAKDFTKYLQLADGDGYLTELSRVDQRLQRYAAEKVMEAVAEVYFSYFTDDDGEPLHLTPIEQLMGCALRHNIGCRVWTVDVANVDYQYPIATPQGNYRLDFAIHGLMLDGRTAKIAVECDGHDFHEKTKKQAARDKSRDRALTAEGYTVMHFTGSEIWKNPDGCACEVWAMFDRLMGLKRGVPVVEE